MELGKDFSGIADNFEATKIEPVQILYQSDTQKLLVVVKVATSKSGNGEVQIASYEVKLELLEVELVNSAVVPAFTHSDRTSKFIIIYADESRTNGLALDPETLSTVATLSNIATRPSKNDDFIFVRSTESNNSAVNFLDLANSPKNTQNLAKRSGKGCQMQRIREPE